MGHSLAEERAAHEFVVDGLDLGLHELRRVEAAQVSDAVGGHGGAQRAVSRMHVVEALPHFAVISVPFYPLICGRTIITIEIAKA